MMAKRKKRVEAKLDRRLRPDPGMSKDEYREIIDKLGLSQVKAGPFLGVDQRTSRSYALGESVVPWLAAILLRVMIKYKINTEDIMKLARPKQ
jgi:hypothetical protein